MAIRTVVTRGYGNGTFDGTIALLVVRGYLSAEAPAAPVPPLQDFPGGARGGDITKLIMDKEKLLEDRIHADDEDVLSIIVFAIEEGIIE